ncbi:unnamed protein product [Trichogramma brassicae]|uniref:Uncharacterized protein n=1 Tax=Trichogramma brassicae TaxID=86971 RepID=A0A6H5J079_9HYME|nr:unnamed protein product [Trichogramma brassicae]
MKKLKKQQKQLQQKQCRSRAGFVVGTVGRVGEEYARNDGAAADRQDCSVEQMDTRKSTQIPQRYRRNSAEMEDSVRWIWTDEKRTQGPEERVAEYVICVQSVLRKLRPELDVQTQLDYLHVGMLPDLQKMVCRKYLRSVDDLMQEALEAENTIKKADQYRAPTSDETTLPELKYSPGKREETSYRISSLSNPNDEVSTLMQAQIEVTQRLSESVKELQSRLTSLEERFGEKKQTELLQRIFESITELQNYNCNPSGKPDGRKHQEKRKSTQQRKNVSSTQQAGMETLESR